MTFLKAVSMCAALTSSAVFATPLTFFDTIENGQASFNDTVTSTNASVDSYTLTKLDRNVSQWDFSEFSIMNVDGGTSGIYSAAADGTTGEMIIINPQGSGSDPENYKRSGITFNFNSAINAIGFEVGDWATCCTPSSLYMQFDGGEVQLIGTAKSYSDNPAIAAGKSKDGIFVGAIEDASTFSSVTFWGDAYGEFLTAGGTIMWSTVEVGSVSVKVPEPATLGLLGVGIMGLFMSSRKQRIHDTTIV